MYNVGGEQTTLPITGYLKNKRLDWLEQDFFHWLYERFKYASHEITKAAKVANQKVVIDEGSAYCLLLCQFLGFSLFAGAGNRVTGAANVSMSHLSRTWTGLGAVCTFSPCATKKLMCWTDEECNKTGRQKQRRSLRRRFLQCELRRVVAS